ncbi:MAG: dipeptidase [Erysipelotrichaceae bacterium]|nr:dipeptidase [Erysipelotrichaceae bacterium]
MNYKAIDMHCDTVPNLLYGNGQLRENDGHLSLLKMKKGGYMMQCFAMFVYLQSQDYTPFAQCNRYIDFYYEQINKNSDLIRPATTVEEISENDRNGLMSAMLTIEEGGVLEGKLENLQHFYDRGVRMMTLTWNFENEIGYPNYMSPPDFRPDTERGLKPFGFEVINRMWDLGMIVDVSHLNDAGIYDVLSCARKPIVASHSNSRAIMDFPRNLTDDMLVKLRQNGGITGINYCPDFISAQTDQNQIPDIVRHVKHIVEVAGIETVALGSDFDGIDTPVGMSDCTKTVQLAEALKDAGFSDDDLNKIYHENFLRVLQANQR